MSKLGTNRPFAVTVCGIDELTGFHDSQVSHVLSILDPDMTTPRAFERFAAHKRLELRFHDVIEDPVPGYAAPQIEHIEALFAFGRDMAAGNGEHLLVHCHMGISRSTAAAVLLWLQAHPALEPQLAVAEIVRIRPQAWPNLRMIELGDRALDLGGKLVRAVRGHHRDVARAQPNFAEFMRENGRARELE
jgi:predicted protein tyrosine phosphatase